MAGSRSKSSCTRSFREGEGTWIPSNSINGWIGCIAGWACISPASQMVAAPSPESLERPEVDERLRLTNDWLRNREVFLRAQDPVNHIDVDREADLVTELQGHVLSVLARRGVVIEINPSSNLLIGHLGDLVNHPLWRICPPKAGEYSRQVRVCIGSDDPITFATSLPRRISASRRRHARRRINAAGCR